VPTRWILGNNAHAGPIRRITSDVNADDSWVHPADRIRTQGPLFTGVASLARQTKGGAFCPGLYQPLCLTEVSLRPDMPPGQQYTLEHPAKHERRNGQASDNADHDHPSSSWWIFGLVTRRL